MDLELQNLEEKSYRKSMGFKSWKIIALLTLTLLLVAFVMNLCVVFKDIFMI